MPRNSAIFVRFAIASGFALASGCAGPSAQVGQIQAEKQELLATVKAQKEEQETLRKKADSLEQRLDQSEKEIVRLTGRKSTWDEGTRSASTKNLLLPLGEGRGEGLKTASPKQDEKPTSTEKLPWRPPATPSSTPKPSTTPLKEPAATDSPIRTGAKVTPSLRSLAQRDARLQYDPATDTARYQGAITFEASGAGLTAQGRKRLDDLASWLQADQTKELHILVSGSSAGLKNPKPAEAQLNLARAGAVAAYLGRHGIREDRLVVAGGTAKPLDEASGSPVQIHLADSSAPILGLLPKQPALRR